VLLLLIVVCLLYYLDVVPFVVAVFCCDAVTVDLSVVMTFVYCVLFGCTLMCCYLAHCYV
jgi:hypothetical protein